MSPAPESNETIIGKTTPEHGVLEHVQQQIDDQIRSLKEAKRFYRRGSLTQTVSSSTLAALTTLLIGIDQIYGGTLLATLSLISAGLTTILTAWGGWFGFRRLWVNNQHALNQLYELRARIQYDSVKHCVPLDAKVVDEYFERYQSIMSEANRVWEEARASQE